MKNENTVAMTTTTKKIQEEITSINIGELDCLIMLK